MGFDVHLIDGTYELFRQHFGRKPQPGEQRGEWDGALGVMRSLLAMLADGATHVGVASDHVIESFRNELWPGYKSSEGMAPELLAQIPVLEEGLVLMGVTTWAMVEYEADDALGSAAVVAAADPRVERVLICTPDKDLGQCVGGKVVQVDRRNQKVFDADGIVEKFGVAPASIPDYLGLVGDSADGFPGIAGWGAKSAAAVLARYGHIEHIPAAAGQWDVPGLRGAAKLASSLQAEMELALLFRRIATLELDVEVGEVDDWAWSGPPDPDAFTAFCAGLGSSDLPARARALARR